MRSVPPLAASALALLLALPLLAAPSSLRPAAAAQKTIDLAGLQSLVKGLGYEDTSDKKDFVEFKHEGQFTYDVFLQPLHDGQDVALYIFLGDVPADRLAQLPAEKMLEFNDSHTPAFTISDHDGAKSLYIEYRFPAVAATPQLLRSEIDTLTGAADEGAELWDKAKWGAVADQDAGKASPARFALSNVLFVSKTASGFGMYDKRPSNVFTPGDKLLSYAEVSGMTYKPVGDTFQFGYSVDVEIRTAKGATTMAKTQLGSTTLTSHVRNKEIELDLSLSITGLASGDYVLAYLVHDTNSEQTASIEQPFTVKEQSAAK